MDDDEITTAEALLAVARAIDRLGNADAATPMGGLEALGAVMKEGSELIAAALNDIARAIDHHHSE